METTPSSPSRTMMINCLPETAWLLVTSRSSLNACGKRRLENFGTLVAENMERHPGDPITTLLYLITRPVNGQTLERLELAVALLAIYSLRHGATDASCSELLHQIAQLTSLATSQKNTHTSRITKIELPPLLACLFDLPSE